MPGIGNGNHRDNGSVFDNAEGGIYSPPKNQRAVKQGQMDQ